MRKPIRYPDDDIVVLDPRFAKYKLGNTPIQRIYRGTLWSRRSPRGTESVAIWCGSDIPNDVQLRFLEEERATSARGSDFPPATAMATRSISKADRFRANTERVESSDTNRTERKRYSPNRFKTSHSTHPTTRSYILMTARSGSPTRGTEA